MADAATCPHEDLKSMREQATTRAVTVVLVKPRGARRILAWLRRVTDERDRAIRGLATARGELEAVRQWVDGGDFRDAAGAAQSVADTLRSTTMEALDLPPMAPSGGDNGV